LQEQGQNALSDNPKTRQNTTTGIGLPPAQLMGLSDPAGAAVSGVFSMRYLIVETSWPMMTLSRSLADDGVLLTQTDRPEDIPQLLANGGLDALVLEAETLVQHGLSLMSLRSAFPRVSIALVANKPSRANIAKWLEAGADTVMDNETPPQEIVARIAAITRRTFGYATSLIAFGPLQIDIGRRRAEIDGVALHLTPKVYEILEYMALRPGSLVTRDALLSHVYGFESEPDARVFDVYMCTLRSHLKATRGAVTVQTARGEGFRFLHLEEAEQAA